VKRAVKSAKARGTFHDEAYRHNIKYNLYFKLHISTFRTI
jgi:hypothetical protein